MNRKKRLTAVFAALTMVMLFGLAGSAYAQVQSVALTPSVTQVATDGTFEVTLSYNVSDGDTTLGALGLGIYYDSAVVEFVDGSYVALSTEADSFRQSDPVQAFADAQDTGGFGATGKLVGLQYFTPDGVFPGASTTLPLDICKVTFQAQGAAADAVIKPIGFQPATGYTIEGTDTTVTVGTAPTTYDVTYNIFGNGYLDGATDPVVHTVLAGDDAPTVTASAMNDNEFVNWTDADSNVVSTDAALTITGVMAAATYTANFQAIPDTYTVTFVAGPNGSLSGETSQEVTAGGDCSAVTATADTGYVFNGWTGGYIGTDNPLTVLNVTMAMTITANFIPDTDPCAGTAAVITPLPASVQQGITTTWDGTSSTVASGDSIVVYGWTYYDNNHSAIGSDGSSSTQRVFHFATDPGDQYSIKLDIETTNGCTASYEHFFAVVEDAPCNASASISGPATGTVGQAVSFDGSASAPSTGSTIDSYNWDMDFDGSNWDADVVGSTGATWTYDTAGEYTVGLAISDEAGCQATATHTITIEPASVIPDGDGNNDGVTDIFDALIAAMYDIDLLTAGEIAALDMLDVNQDGDVTIVDALMIAKYDVGLYCGCVLDPKK